MLAAVVALAKWKLFVLLWPAHTSTVQTQALECIFEIAAKQKQPKGKKAMFSSPFVKDEDRVYTVKDLE